MSSDNSYKRSTPFENADSDTAGDSDVHIPKKRMIEPNWQEQLQSAAEVTPSRLLKYQQIEDGTQLPREPATVEQTRMQLPLRLTAASLSGDLYRISHFSNPVRNQFNATTTPARVQMDPSALPTPPQDDSNTPTDTITPTAPNAFKTIFTYNRYDYDFQTLTQGYTGELNFTAVEIITFLPRLFHNSSIARRFVNNGMENRTHAEISNRHRTSTPQVYDIANSYLDALRPWNWRKMPKEQYKTFWSRRTHRTPAKWDTTNIAMNAFVPDRLTKEGFVAEVPASVSFPMLLHGVKKLPTGDDAADLTRAIKFATGDGAKKMFPGRYLLFPDDLIDIFRAIGHVTITDQHRDKAVVRRYLKLSYVKHNDKQDTNATPGRKRKGRSDDEQSPSGSRQDPGDFVPVGVPSPLLQSPRQTAPQETWVNYLPTSTHATNPFHEATQSKAVPKPVLPMAALPLSEPSQPEQQNTGDLLLRSADLHSISHIVPSIDMSRIASVIEYARRADQKDIAWYASSEHIAHITRILEDELGSATTLSDERAAWEEHWEQVEGEQQHALDDSITAVQQ
ncbi:hypothetical protein SLS60_002966 [Paraconiothyrium brasiliense]|uniref:Uncharacterized protein n=1 Tax=Paraconiothyrium brasiliense TaxID=300254 RepID=A0ABR3RUA9_9PLEO